MSKILRAGLAASAVVCAFTFAASASASVVRLDFEGVGSQARVSNFYNGGTDSQGNSGPNFGISFGANALALRESDPTAGFALAPSRETVMFFVDGTAVVNVAAGFQNGFSFWYSTVSLSAQVTVWSGLNATGNQLGTIQLAALGAGPVLDRPFSNWAVGSFGFSGLARSIDFGGTANEVAYDNITFGSTSPVPVPEPGSLALVSLALAALAVGVRRRKS